MKKKIWGTLDPFHEGGAILGRKVANSSFFDALLSEDPFEEYHFFYQDIATIHAMESYVRDSYPALSQRGAFTFCLQRDFPKSLVSCEYHCFHLSDPIKRHVVVSAMRNKYAQKIFPVTSVTHSLSNASYMQSFLEHAWEGCSRRDAIIATSQSGKNVLNSFFSHLASGFGRKITKYVPSTPIIPLGVSFNQSSNPLLTDAVRKKIGEENLQGLVLLSLSRISLYSKMDFLPLLYACKRAESMGLTRGEYCLVIAGWVDDEGDLIEPLVSMANHLGVSVKIIACPTGEEKNALYELADIFLSPSDNIQETFGMTVIEAGSFGVPSIVSDFDGYKDTVIDGVTGVRIPTLGFSSTSETDALSLLWADSQYHLKLAQQTAIDIPSFAQAIADLATNKELRLAMGAAAKCHIDKEYSWTHVIKQYTKLWDNLWGIPITTSENKRIRKATHPLQMDFAKIFTHHFSGTLSDETASTMMVMRTEIGTAYYQGVIKDFPYAGLDIMLSKEVLHTLLFIARNPVRLNTLLDKLIEHETSMQKEKEQLSKASIPHDFLRERVSSVILWALKHDLITKVHV